MNGIVYEVESLETLRTRVGMWCDTNFPDLTEEAIMLASAAGMSEELGELLESGDGLVCAPLNVTACLDAVADMCIFSLDLCYHADLDMQRVLTCDETLSRWECAFLATADSAVLHEGLAVLIGRVSHHALKIFQGIRRTEDHYGGLCTNLCHIWRICYRISEKSGKNLNTLVSEVAETVLKRDWRKHPDTAHEVQDFNSSIINGLGVPSEFLSSDSPYAGLGTALRTISGRGGIPRLPWDLHWMVMAHLTATRSTCDRGPELLFDPGRHGVGAVLVRDNRLIASGYSGSAPGQPHCNEFRCVVCGAQGPSPSELRHSEAAHAEAGFSGDGTIEGGHMISDGHCVRTIHAELNAVLQCALDGVSPKGAVLYCTASPCFDCTKALIRVGVKHVFYHKAYDSRYGLSGSVQELLERSGIGAASLSVPEHLFAATKQLKGE